MKINLPVTLQPAVKLMSALQFSFRSSISLPLQQCSTGGAWLQSIVTPQWCAGGGRLPLCVEAKLRHGAARGLPAAAEERLSPGYTVLHSTTVLYCDARCPVSSAARCRWSGASRWRERSAPPPRPPPPPAGPSHASCANWWSGRTVPPPRPRPARLPHCVARYPASSARPSPGRSAGQRPGLSQSVSPTPGTVNNIHFTPKYYCIGFSKIYLPKLIQVGHLFWGLSRHETCTFTDIVATGNIAQ